VVGGDEGEDGEGEEEEDHEEVELDEARGLTERPGEAREGEREEKGVKCDDRPRAASSRWWRRVDGARHRRQASRW
jgi:hypothetical protein